MWLRGMGASLLALARWRNLVGQTERAAVPSQLESADEQLIRTFLQARARHPDRGPERAESPTFRISGPTVYTVQGGWYIVVRSPHNNYFLSLDQPAVAVEPSPQYWRERIAAIAAEVGVTVLPVTRHAYMQATGDAVGGPYVERAKPAEVIDVNSSLESVFSVDNKFYLSGYDTQERPPLYFLCRLPHRVATVAEAREALKPVSVKAAEAQGWAIERQGDIFAIESGLTKRQIEQLGGTVYGPVEGPARPGHHWPPAARIPIYGTAHTAYHIATLPNHLMLAKGALLHMPSILTRGRRPDHADHKLGDGSGWWWLARNTVPIRDTPPTAQQQMVTAASALQQTVTEVADAVSTMFIELGEFRFQTHPSIVAPASIYQTISTF